jgi:hypothetical protein
LTGNFVNHDKLGIFAAAGPGHTSSRRNSSKNRGQGKQACGPMPAINRDPARNKPP